MPPNTFAGKVLNGIPIMMMVTTPLIPNVHAIGIPIAMVMPITIIKVASIIIFCLFSLTASYEHSLETSGYLSS
jgi:hypothetical protein